MKERTYWVAILRSGFDIACRKSTLKNRNSGVLEFRTVRGFGIKHASRVAASWVRIYREATAIKELLTISKERGFKL